MTLLLFQVEKEHGAGELQDVALRGVNGVAEDECCRPLQCFTIKMPLPLYLEFKREVQLLRALSNPETKQHFTITTFVNAAVKKVILPSIRKADRDRLLEAGDSLV